MSNPQIGTFGIDIFGGFMHRPARAVSILANFANVDGVTLVKGAWSIPVDHIPTAIIAPDSNSADTLMDALAGLQGDGADPVTVIDSLGFIYDQVNVVSVDSHASYQADGTYRVDSQWVLQQTTYEPS
jgi:hypothetical protein